MELLRKQDPLQLGRSRPSVSNHDISGVDLAYGIDQLRKVRRVQILPTTSRGSHTQLHSVQNSDAESYSDKRVSKATEGKAKVKGAPICNHWQMA